MRADFSFFTKNIQGREKLPLFFDIVSLPFPHSADLIRWATRRERRCRHLRTACVVLSSLADPFFVRQIVNKWSKTKLKRSDSRPALTSYSSVGYNTAQCSANKCRLLSF